MYTIYEIPGVKVGCDAHWPNRAKEQGVDPKDCLVLQQETDVIQASIDEIWWQIEKDYPVDDVPYFIVRQNNIRRQSHEASVRGGKVSGPIEGRKNVELKRGWFSMSEEEKFKQRSRAGKNGGPIGGKVTGNIHKESGHIQNIGRISCTTVHICPHCNKSGKGPAFKSFHIINKKCILKKV